MTPDAARMRAAAGEGFSPPPTWPTGWCGRWKCRSAKRITSPGGSWPLRSRWACRWKASARRDAGNRAGITKDVFSAFGRKLRRKPDQLWRYGRGKRAPRRKKMAETAGAQIRLSAMAVGPAGKLPVAMCVCKINPIQLRRGGTRMAGGGGGRGGGGGGGGRGGRMGGGGRRPGGGGRMGRPGGTRAGSGRGPRPPGIKPARGPLRGRRGKRKLPGFKPTPTGSNSTGGRQRNVKHPLGTEDTRTGKTGKRQTRMVNKPQQTPRGKGGR